jgi:dynein heavy chain
VIEGLANDALSIDNGVICTKCQRWPLCIDPQGEAHKWIKKHEESHDLKIINFSETHYLKTIQTSIQSGYSVLIENVEEKLEPAIDSVLQKQIFEEDNRRLIRVGEKKIDYDDKFKLFITTKMSNPHYLPEIYIKVTVINFSITFEGLKDQLLGDVVKY